MLSAGVKVFHMLLHPDQPVEFSELACLLMFQLLHILLKLFLLNKHSFADYVNYLKIPTQCLCKNIKLAFLLELGRSSLMNKHFQDLQC